jgi:hypothetical protein
MKERHDERKKERKQKKSSPMSSTVPSKDKTTIPSSTARITATSDGNRAAISRTVDTHSESAEQQFGTSRTNEVAKEKKFAHTGLNADIKSESIKKSSADGKWSKEITSTTIQVATSGKCQTCQESLGTEPILEVSRKKYHSRCLQCHACEKKLNPHRIMLDRSGTWPMCEPCAKAPPAKGKK